MWATFKDWYSQPFSQEMDATHWSLFIAFVLVTIILWNRVLAHMGEGF